jgi:hypothetical protein
MKKENYTKEEVTNLIDELNDRVSVGRKLTSIDVIVQEFKREKGLLEEEFKVGDWISDEKEVLIKITEVNEISYFGYGFVDGAWHSFVEIRIDYSHLYKPANPKEVSEALKREGDKYIGKKVKCLLEGTNFIVGKYHDYYQSPNEMFYSNGNGDYILLMKDGKWADVIEEEPKEKKWEELSLEERLKKWEDYMKFIRSEIKIMESNPVKVRYVSSLKKEIKN